MALDGIFLKSIKDEISPQIIGARVEKIHQPSREELVLHLRSRQGAYKLFLSVRVNSPRVHLTANPPENPATPPMFCMLMRKKLTNSLLVDIRQPALERVLYFDFEAVNDIGDKVLLTLSIEIMAKHSNIMLTDENGRIVDAIKRIDFSRSEVRQILPGFPYTPPPAQDKLDLITAETAEIIERIENFENKTISSAILNSCQGVSPLICREIAFNCGGDIYVCDMNTKYKELLCGEIDKIKEIIENNGGIPCCIKDETGKPCDFAFLEINQYGSMRTCQQKESFSQLLDEFYSEKDTVERTRQKGRDLVKFLHNAIERTAKKLNLQRAELEKCADREELRISAELINANLYQLQKGSLYYDLPNYYDNNNILRVKADPALSPAANAQRYFKLYRKAKTAEQMLTELIIKGEDDLQYLESVADALDRSTTQAEIDEIKAELVVSGFLKAKGGAKKKALRPSEPFEYETSEGFRVLVGRNNLQNDKLTFKTAHKNDMWLHTQKIHGSHVIILSENKEITDDAIVEAAEIAAYHSKACEAKLVPVDYTPVKNIKKPQGAPPGKVIYHVYYSVNVSPDKAIIEAKLKSKK
ncbi:MAG: NFACT family protein [Clostridia bacterium]|nr:NFACT family protein [Clostridia bacterium]